MRCCGISQPSQPLPEAGRPWRGPPDSLGLRPGSGGPRPLEAAPAGGQGCGVGTGPVPVLRDGAAAAEKTLSSRGGNSNGASRR